MLVGAGPSDHACPEKILALCRVKDLEQECKHARDAKSSAEQRAAAADARVDMLSKAVQKAESRATLLEQRAQTISSGTVPFHYPTSLSFCPDRLECCITCWPVWP